MTQVVGRALHYVLKVGNLRKNVEFFRDKLQMTVLRHEVFEKGCEAACNGPYNGKWSKTMIGYGPEDDHFVLELTYNYSIGSYKLGNDLQHIKISLDANLFDLVKEGLSSSVSLSSQEKSQMIVYSPDGYKFLVTKEARGFRNDITEVCLAVSNLSNSLNYWTNLLNMKQHGDVLRYSPQPQSATGSVSGTHHRQQQQQQAALRLQLISEPMDHKSAYGRIAFSCGAELLKPIQKLCEDQGHKILTPYLSLDTPGKATVQVVILADPDGHEICFVGDEGFRQLSQVEPEANSLIERSILEDKSDEWFQKKNLAKEEA